MINPDHIINYTKATPEEKQKIKAILLSNYAILVNEFIKEADYSNVSGYWKDFRPMSPEKRIMSPRVFITKYNKLLPKITPVRAKEENIEQLFKLADQFCEKIKPGTLHGNSKTIISMELGEFLRFAKREIEKNKKLPVLYMVAVDKNSLDRKDQRVDGYLGFGNEVMKICLYGRGQAIKKARIFKGKIVRFNGKPNRRKHYLV